MLSTIINGKSVPSGIWNIDALVQSKYTDDVQRLFSRTAWYVFMYDDYPIEEEVKRVAFTNENYLLYRNKENDGLVALAATAKDQALITRPTWAEPIRRAASFASAPATRIKGTIHLVSPERIISIDTDVLNLIEFQRRRISLLIPTRQFVKLDGHKPFLQMCVTSLEAWIWEGKREVFEDRITPYTYEPADIVSPKSMWIGDFYTKDKCRR